MYDRGTLTLWRQFTGEPAVGRLAGSGARLDVFPVVVTTWEEWKALHPDTTVLARETGSYPAAWYRTESHPAAAYYNYRINPRTSFPVWLQSDALPPKAIVVGIRVGDEARAYALEDLIASSALHDTIGGQRLVVITHPKFNGSRAYEIDGTQLVGPPELNGDEMTIRDTEGGTWTLTEEALVSRADASTSFTRLPAFNAFWFGWFSNNPDTTLYDSGSAG